MLQLLFALLLNVLQAVICFCLLISLLQADVAKQLDEGKDLKKTVESIKDANKRGALHFAAREGQTEICRYLLEELKLNADAKDEAGLYFLGFYYLHNFSILKFINCET